MKIKELIIFVVGVGVGIGASYNIIKKKHEEILEEEIASVKETYSKNNKESDEVTEEKEPEPEEIASVKEKYEKLTKEYSELKEENCTNSEIYEISYDDFGEEGYEEIELTYYIDDETLTDDADEPMEELDIISSIGSIDILNGCKDGEYIYIRNEEKEIDYSIAISENRRE